MSTRFPVGAVIEAPVVTAAPFGIINSVTLAEGDQSDSALRWEGGVAYESLICAPKVQNWGLCDPGGDVVVDKTGADRLVTAEPFAITAYDTCTAVGGADRRKDAEARVLALLEASTQKAVEREVLLGSIASSAPTLGGGRWLMGPGTTQLPDVAGDPREAIAILEDAYAQCSVGDAGVLHLTRGSAYRARLDADGDVLRTRTGSLVIAGSGYSVGAEAPAGWEGTWAFVTGPVRVWVGDPAVYPEDAGQAVNIRTNDLIYKAERLAAAAYDGCCAFAVKIDPTTAP